MVEVQDTGVGIKKKDIDKLLKPFSMVKNSKNLNPNGIGLGLHICRKVVEKCAGKIWIEKSIPYT